MLRSLVGSEMCIRDSRCDARIDVLEQQRRRGLPQRQEHVAGQRSQLGACLLYTSDAADDLLCVDLGGRRIIKKKKSICIHTSRHLIVYSTSTAALLLLQSSTPRLIHRYAIT